MYLKPRVKAPAPELIDHTAAILRQNGTNTICMESKCPNITECFTRGTATFLILGTHCTRTCAFCNVSHAKPALPDPSEPERVARAVQQMGLRYVVITSVDRDDLKDGGASHFTAVCHAIKERSPATKIELLTPDFKGKKESLDLVIAANPHKLAHNIETVRGLTPHVMPGCSYERSLEVLAYYAASGILTKSSIMVGLGESKEELREAFADLASVGVQQLTIGQYLRPTPSHWPVKRYYEPQEFEELGLLAKEAGIAKVVSGVLVRSSYYADIL